MASQQEQPQTECAVCMDDIWDGKKLSVWIRCGHVFHDECNQGVLAHSEDPRCPICRIASDQIQTIYLPPFPSQYMGSREAVAELSRDLVNRSEKLDIREAKLKELESQLRAKEEDLQKRAQGTDKTPVRNSSNVSNTLDRPRRRKLRADATMPPPIVRTPNDRTTRLQATRQQAIAQQSRSPPTLTGPTVPPPQARETVWISSDSDNDMEEKNREEDDQLNNMQRSRSGKKKHEEMNKDQQHIGLATGMALGSGITHGEAARSGGFGVFASSLLSREPAAYE